MFMVPGSSNVVRLIGNARLTVDVELRKRFERQGQLPATVIVVRIDQIYSQCARAVMRAGIWSRDDSADLPSVGDILAEMTGGAFDGDTYDREWPERAKKTLF